MFDNSGDLEDEIRFLIINWLYRFRLFFGDAQNARFCRLTNSLSCLSIPERIKTVNFNTITNKNRLKIFIYLFTYLFQFSIFYHLH